MRYYFLILSLFSWLGLLLPPTVVKAVENPSNFFPSQELPDFWPPAQELVQDQINLIAAIEQALVSADPNRVRLVRGQILLHTFAVDRLLKRYYQIPSVLCGVIPGEFDSVPPVGSLDENQVKAYCNLFASTQKLDSLRPILDRRLAMLGGIAEVVEPLPLVTGEIRRDRILGIPRIERGDLSVPATPRLSPLPDLPPAPPPIIGRTAKQPIANYQPPFPPAIATPVQATTPLLAAKAFLNQARRFFPNGTEFTEPDRLANINQFNNYSIYPINAQPYRQFLSLPNTGIAQILPSEFYRPEQNILRNRLIQNFAQSIDFPPLFNPVNEFVPRLELQINNDNFQLANRELNYGFLVDLGNFPIQDIDRTLDNFVTPTQSFFLEYLPPTQLEALQVDRRKFITGKQQNFGLPQPILTEAPVVLNHTYLLRTIQFKLPDFILTGEPLTNNQQRNLNLFLETPSIDLLIAFQPVYRRLDGSYIVLWRIIKQFPDPQIKDLEKYVR
ncbi:MAG TPA: hypothetical protein V6D28_26945 [Leptolyngbyaceae cyanobacterium]